MLPPNEDFDMLESKFLKNQVDKLRNSVKSNTLKVRLSKSKYGKLQDKYLFFVKYMNEQMLHNSMSGELDRHKIASAMTLAILESRVFNIAYNAGIDETKTTASFGVRLINELLAFCTSFEILQAHMLKAIAMETGISEGILNQCGARVTFPTMVRDKGNYVTNFLRVFYHISQQPLSNLKYSAWLLCLIYHHIEVYSREIILSDIANGKYKITS